MPFDARYSIGVVTTFTARQLSGAAAVTLSSSCAIGDVFKVKHSLHRSPKDARLFYTNLAAYVASGIGFLGTGAILRHGTTARGLTTAASLWSAAGIGIAVGVGLAELATVTVLLILFTLVEHDDLAAPDGPGSHDDLFNPDAQDVEDTLVSADQQPGGGSHPRP
jgi:uncharacterized membrane protein YhiD involved in acid resistance